MKQLLTALSILISVTCISQPVSNRSSSSLTIADSRLMAFLNLYIPKYTDTTAANLQKGIDSCGAIIFTYTGNKIWKRSCNPKKWQDIAPTQLFKIFASYGLSNVNDSTLKVDTTLISTLNKVFRDSNYLKNLIDLRELLSNKVTTITSPNATDYPTTGAVNGFVASSISGKLNISDTSGMLSPYQAAINARVRLTGGTITNPVTIVSSNYNVPISVVQGDYRRTGGVLTIANQNGTYTTGTYTGISPTGGSGTGLVVTATVTSNNTVALIPTTAGIGYMVGDKIIINNTAIGGVSGTTTFTVFSINNATTLNKENAPASFTNYLMEANSGTDNGGAFTPIAKFNAINRDGSNVTSPLIIGTSWVSGGNPLMSLRFNNINQINFANTQPIFPLGFSSNGTTTFNGSTNFNANPTFGGAGPSIFGMGININNTSSYGLINSLAQNNNSTLNYRPATMYGSNTTQVRGAVASLTITNAGTGGTNSASPIGLSFTGGSGTGLTVSGTIVGGSLATLSVSTIQQQQAGSNFVQGETITITGNGLIGATATVNLISIPTTAFNANDIFNSNSANHYYAFNGTPTVNQTTGATGDIIGFRWNPTLTALLGRNIAFQNVTGDNIFNSTSGSTLIGKSTNAGLGKVEIAGNLALTTAGNKLVIATGSNASVGTATLASGTVTVNTTAVTANSIILLTLQNCSTCGTPYISAKTAGTSFVISSTNAIDGSIIGYQIIN